MQVDDLILHTLTCKDPTTSGKGASSFGSWTGRAEGSCLIEVEKCIPNKQSHNLLVEHHSTVDWRVDRTIPKFGALYGPLSFQEFYLVPVPLFTSETTIQAWQILVVCCRWFLVTLLMTMATSGAPSEQPRGQPVESNAKLLYNAPTLCALKSSPTA